MFRAMGVSGGGYGCRASLVAGHLWLQGDIHGREMAVAGWRWLLVGDYCRVEWKQEHPWSILTCREVWEEWKENREGMG
jgi:hypothetical protein